MAWFESTFVIDIHDCDICDCDCHMKKNHSEAEDELSGSKRPIVYCSSLAKVRSIASLISA